MRNTIKYTVMAACISLASVQAWGDQTNLVRNLDISLVGIEQGGTSTAGNVTTIGVDNVNVETADIVGAIGVATGNNFSSNAQLVAIMPLSGGSATVAIRDGGNSVDVTAFFAESYLSDVVEKSTFHSKTGKANGSNYSLQQFSLQDSSAYQPLALHYVVSGVTVEDFSIPAIPGPRSELSAEVSGTGDIGGNLLLLKGKISISGQTVEVVAGGGGPAT
jgi:hypothetical protein